MRKAPVHLPGLNGLRAIAAIAVVISHTTLYLDRFGLDRHVFGSYSDGTARGLDLATYGVTLFFTLSGFLITHLLLRERTEIGGVNIRAFYVRRILRIWPLYYAYLAVAMVVVVSAGLAWSGRSLFYYATLLANVPRVYGNEIALVDHLWSIGVEEQFYLLWPWVVAAVPGRLVRLTTVAIGVLVSLVLISKFILVPHGWTAAAAALSMVRFQAMLIGCLGALLWNGRQAWFTAYFTQPLIHAAAWCCLLLIGLNHFPVPSFIGNEVVSVIALVLIMGQVNRRHGMIDLERPLFDRLGRISYGTYVLHPLIIFLFAEVTGGLRWLIPTARYGVIYFSVLVLSLIAASISYRHFETPFLRWKDRFAVVRSRAHMGR